MNFLIVLLFSVIPLKSVKIFWDYFEMVEQFVVVKNPKQQIPFFAVTLVSIYYCTLSAIFLCFPDISNKTKIIFSDWNFILLNEKSFYLFYVFQAFMITYFKIVMYLWPADIRFVRHMRDLMFGNDMHYNISFIDNIKNLFIFYIKRHSTPLVNRKG